MRDWLPALESRAAPSSLMRLCAPLIAGMAITLTALLAFVMLQLPPWSSLHAFFIFPIASPYGVGEWLLKATPLALCGLGLSVAFRANVWNIGAEGQFTAGAIAGGGVALYASPQLGAFGIPAMLLAGMGGGMLWAAIPAVLRTRFHTSEILSSLMLVYVAQLLLAWLMHGQWQDPQGFKYPQSRAFDDTLVLPLLGDGQRATVAVWMVAAMLLATWLLVSWSHVGYRMWVGGEAPAAARYAGFSESRNVWLGMLISGGAAGLAGIAEVAGPIGRLQTSISPGYGFAAIIVAFVGRLHPLGVVLSALLMSLLYLGGEAAQLELGLPSAVTGIFQGLLLFYLLGADVFTRYRLRWSPRSRTA